MMNLQQLNQLVATLQGQNMQSAVASAGQSSGGVQTYPTSLIIPFDYVTAFSLSANATGTATLQMASDSAFELLRILAVSSADTPTAYWQNNFSCLMTDQSTGRQLASSNVPQCCLVTNAYQYGNDEKYPILFPAQAIVNFALANLTAANLTGSIIFKGYKIFQTSPQS